MKNHKKRELLDKIATWTLLSVGIITIIFQLLDQMANYVPSIGFLQFNYTTSGIPLLLFIVSTLTIAIGLERYATLAETQEEIRNRHLEIIQAVEKVKDGLQTHEDNVSSEILEIHQTLNATATVKPLMGREAVYQEASRLIKMCKGVEVIRATSLTIESGDELDEESPSNPFNSYLEMVANKITEERKNVGMIYKVVMGFQAADGIPSATYKKRILKRIACFQKHNILDRIMIRQVQNKVMVTY